jgi:hypothetical protein
MLACNYSLTTTFVIADVLQYFFFIYRIYMQLLHNLPIYCTIIDQFSLFSPLSQSCLPGGGIKKKRWWVTVARKQEQGVKSNSQLI